MTVDLFDTILASVVTIVLISVWFSNDDWRE
jgi:hypothetical protein